MAILNEVCQLLFILLSRDKFIICNGERFWQQFAVNTDNPMDFLLPFEQEVVRESTEREHVLDTRFVDAEFAAKQRLVLANEETDTAKQKEAVDKEIEQRIKILVDLGMTVDEATLQVARNMEDAEAAASGPSAAGSKKQPKGKGKKWTRKNLRVRRQ